ncbi:MAG: hypothetical protein MI725_15320 [Pirellulales bacterium]|nr:hypothetical protein [Pirellulales bacterium]
MFDEIAALAQHSDKMLQCAAQQLLESGDLHRLFDLRLLECRHRLGLPLEQESSLQDLAEPLRSELEAAYLAACREVGQLFLDQGGALEAWSYLRPAGEKPLLQKWLGSVIPDEARADELIELALYQGVDPERGFAWLLAQRGTCNALTELESLATQLPVSDQAACAALLVRHLHEELLGNIRGHLQRLEQEVPTIDSLSTLLDEHPTLLSDGAYHVDTSHLATTVRFARLLTEPALLQLAVDLAEYGSHLDQDLQYPDQPPFENLYETHLQFFRGILGEHLDQAIDYFGKRARHVAVPQYGTTAIETYLILLVRTSRPEQALAEYLEVVPADCVLSPLAPSLLQLAQASGAWERYFEICRQRNDLVGFATGKLLHTN